jgi:hypothetical protein
MRSVVIVLLDKDGACGPHPVECHPQVEIRRERPALEPIELRVLELLPPGGLGVLGQEGWRGGVLHNSRWSVGYVIVWPD